MEFLFGRWNFILGGEICIWWVGFLFEGWNLGAGFWGMELSLIPFSLVRGVVRGLIVGVAWSLALAAEARAFMGANPIINRLCACMFGDHVMRARRSPSFFTATSKY